MWSSAQTVGANNTLLHLHRTGRAGRRAGVIVIGGDTYDASFWKDIDQFDPPIGGHLSGILEAGFPVCGIDMGTLWGNSTMMTRITDVAADCKSTGFFANEDIHILGISAGGLSAAKYLKLNPTLVKSIVTVIPAFPIQNIWDVPRNAGFKTELTAAYGGRPGNTDDPYTDRAAYAATADRHRMFYSTTDTVMIGSESETFAQDTGCELISIGAVGHTWMGEPFSGVKIAAWFDQHD